MCFTAGRSVDGARCCCVCRDDQVQLQSRLAAIEKKIIVGGENLLEKAEEQEKLLEQSAKELDERKAKYERLQREVEEKEVRTRRASGTSIYC